MIGDVATSCICVCVVSSAGGKWTGYGLGLGVKHAQTQTIAMHGATIKIYKKKMGSTVYISNQYF
jgi:hypothetical protein